MNSLDILMCKVHQKFYLPFIFHLTLLLEIYSLVHMRLYMPFLLLQMQK